jgi:hypothetical protein
MRKVWVSSASVASAVYSRGSVRAPAKASTAATMPQSSMTQRARHNAPSSRAGPIGARASGTAWPAAIASSMATLSHRTAAPPHHDAARQRKPARSAAAARGRRPSLNFAS